jgi:bifunctional non-homologous end joining protein LigD
MLATETKTPPNIRDNDFVWEIKYDGIRAWINKSGNDVKIFNREMKEITKRFPELVKDALKSKLDFILDGEIVILNKEGVSDFQAVSHRTHLEDKYRIKMLSEKSPVTFMAFDIIGMNGTDLKTMSYCLRKDKLAYVITDFERIKYVNYNSNDSNKIEALRKEGYEGIIWKQANSLYEMNKRSPNWLKQKFKSDTDLKVINFETNNAGKKLYLENEIVIQCSGAQSKSVNVGDVVTVEYLGITNDGRLRQPVFRKKVIV